MNTLSIPFLLTLALAGSALQAAAQGPAPYLDDRSDGATLVRSLYNAINRKEFARAYGYFSGKKPSVDYKTFVEGYADTANVEIRIGTVKTEGAAGSIYAPVPVALKSIGRNGKVRFFSGCYITRIVNPAIQEPPFTPLHIESVMIKPATGPLDKALPAVCRP